MELEKLKSLLFAGSKPSNHKISDWIKDTHNLPQRPRSFMKLLELVYNHTTDKKKLVKEIANDKELTGKLLKLPNMNKQENLLDSIDIASALENLERNFIEGTLETNICRKYNLVLNGLPNGSLLPSWQHSVKSGIIAKNVAIWVNYQHPEIAFFSALLKYMPQMIMYSRDPLALSKLQESISRGLNLREAELVAYGFDSREFGSKLHKYYSMPEELIELAEKNFDPEQVKQKNKKLANLLRFAEFISLSFADKTQSPSSIWAHAQPYLKGLELDISSEEWANKISILFVKSLEFEMSVTM
jgi:HD-like signal output (HDOD) protein